MDTQVLDDALAGLSQFLRSPEQWVQFAALIPAVVLTWLVARLLHRREARSSEAEEGISHEVFVALRRIGLPILFGLLCLLLSALLRRFELPFAALSTAAILALTLSAIRLLMEALRRILQPGPMLAASGQAITWSIWAVVALYLLGWAQPVGEALDSIAIPLGKSRFSLLDALRVMLTVLLFVVAAAYLGSLATKRIMASTQLSIGVRVGVAKGLRFVLIVLALLLALNSVGVDLAALTVFSGALGVGLGFGLQRIAANFISGFILIGDRSIRPGDVITIGTRFGVVKELRARYIVVQDRDGVDTLIPNENVISTEVINWSYGDKAIRLKLPVQISYADNPRRGLALLEQAARKHPRVLNDPAPAARIMSFGDNGIDLELRFWIIDPEDGVGNVRSDLYLQIWDLFEAEGITIPFPQRDLHLPGGWPPGTPPGLPSDADQPPPAHERGETGEKKD